MAVQARQRDDSGRPIQLVYVRTARLVYPDFQVYCFVHHVHVCRCDKECSCSCCQRWWLSACICSVSTTTTFNTATQLVEWMSKPRNQEELDVFSVKVLTCLRGCLSQKLLPSERLGGKLCGRATTNCVRLHLFRPYGRSLSPRQ